MTRSPTLALARVAVLLAALTACASDPPPPTPGPGAPRSSTSADDPFSAARTAPDAPPEVRVSPSRFSCGDVVLTTGGAVPPGATRCLEQRIGRSSAELAVAQHTTEGDPVVAFYLTRPDLDGYDVVIDQRQDHFSNGGWALVRCTGASALDDPGATCTER